MSWGSQSLATGSFFVFVSLFLIVCQHPAAAVTCVSGSTDNMSCCGDMCYAGLGNNDIIFIQDCISGPLMNPFLGKCLGDDTSQACFCDKPQNCNNASFSSFPVHFPKPNLTCDSTIFNDNNEVTGVKNITCIGCTVYQAGNITNYGCMSPPTWDDFTGFLNNSCVAVTSYAVSGLSITCTCTTGANCARKLLTAQKTASKKVTCYIDSDGNGTCTGDYCFIQQNPYSLLRGCVTFDSNYPNPISTGYFTTLTNQVYVCNSSNYCNVDWNTAQNSLPAAQQMQPVSCLPAGVTAPPYTGPSTTTTPIPPSTTTQYASSLDVSPLLVAVLLLLIMFKSPLAHTI